MQALAAAGAVAAARRCYARAIMRPFTDDRREALRERVRAFGARLPRRGRAASGGDGIRAAAVNFPNRHW